jgi:hypothetical protein
MANPKSLTTLQSDDPVVNRMFAQLTTAVGPLLKATLAKNVSVPGSASAQGVVGQWAADDSYLYVCVAQNSWKRVAIAGW